MARGRPRPGEDPVVAPAHPGGKGAEHGGVLEQRAHGAGHRPAGLSAGRNDQDGQLGRARREVGGQPGAELPDQPGAPELHLPGPISTCRILKTARLSDGAHGSGRRSRSWNSIGQVFVVAMSALTPAAYASSMARVSGAEIP